VIRKQHILLVVSFIISALFLYAALKDVSFTDVARIVQQSQWQYAIPLLICYSVYYFLKLVRWQRLLKPIRESSLSDLFTPMMLGFFANNILPTRLGEFVRMYLGGRKLNLPYSQVLATIVLERVLDILVITLFLGMTLLLSDSVSQNMARLGYVAALLSISIIVTLAVFTYWTDKMLTIVSHALLLLPKALREAVMGHLELAAVGLQALSNRKNLLLIGLSSIGQWLFMVFAIQCSLVAMAIDGNFIFASLVLVFIVIAVSIPSAPGFFGSIQAAYVFALKPVFVDENNAIAASVFFHVFTYLSVTLLGFYLLKKIGADLHQIRVDGETAKHSVEPHGSADPR